MGLVRTARTLAGDIKNFGPGFLRHRFTPQPAGKVIGVSVRGIGEVFVRIANSDIETLREIFGGRAYDLSYPAVLRDRVAARYDAIVADGAIPVIVDAGANIGAASIWFSRAYPKAHVVAVEPDPGNTAILRRNLVGRINCSIAAAAIGSVPGFVDVADGDTDGQGWGKQTTRADDGVPIITIPGAVAMVPGGRVFIVKVDIEGFESDLFASETDWLDDVEAVIIEPHDWMKPGERTSFAFQRAMARHPFELFIHGENLVYARA